MPRNALRTAALPLVLAVALTGFAGAGAPPAKAPAAPAAVTVKSVISKWSGQQVRIVKDGNQIEVKNLLAVGDDFIKIEATEGETYIPLARIKSLNVQGDKLFIHLN